MWEGRAEEMVGFSSAQWALIRWVGREAVRFWTGLNARLNPAAKAELAQLSALKARETKGEASGGRLAGE